MELDIEITRRQEAFIGAGEFEVLYGGAAGGGKSYGQLVDALLFALKFPGSRQLVLRRTFPELQRSLIVNSFGLFLPVARYRDKEKLWTFATGSTVEFGYCATLSDVYQYQSAEYDVIRFDELTHFLQEQYEYMLSRCRGVNSFPKQVKSSTNPGNVGHAWVKARFIDAGPPGSVICGADGLTRVFIPAKVHDNPFLMKADPGYIQRLEQLDEHNKKALLYGDWDIFRGQYFSEFDRALHVVAPFEAPGHWRRYVVLDYGLDMLAAYWIALDDVGRAFVYRELYEGRDNGHEGHIASAAAQRIRGLPPQGEDIYAYLAPPDLWNKHQDTGHSTADYFYEAGIMLEKAANERVMGWLALKEWLRPFPDVRQGGADGAGAACTDGEEGLDEKAQEEKDEKEEKVLMTAGLLIFENCLNLIRCLPGLVYDGRNVNDVAREPHELTHAPDALRYFVAGRPSPAPKPTPPPVHNFPSERLLRGGGGGGGYVERVVVV
jgi:hypothetical protein